MTEASINSMTHTAIESGEGILRMAPNWVPRSLCVPGRRLKLATEDLYAYGAHRGGIDERWFASTTMAMNEERTPDEGLSYVVLEDHRFTLKDAIDAAGPRLIGRKMWDEFRRWPVYSKFFDNLGPIPLHLHPNTAQAKLVGQEGKPEAYYFPPQLNPVDNNFPHTYFGLEPGTTQRAGSKVPGAVGPRRQRHSRSLASVPSEARHRLVGATLHPPCPRVTSHLRAPMGKRRWSAFTNQWPKVAMYQGMSWSRTCRKISSRTWIFLLI